MNQITDKIGLGMYTVHKSTAEDMYGTFQRLAEIGYRAIEFYGEPEFDTDIIKRSLSDSGMKLSGWHIEWRNLQADRFSQTVNYLHKAGCDIAVIPCLGGKWKVNHGPEEECKDIWLTYIEEIGKISEKLKREGIRTGYHNHEHEFMLEYDGKKVFDMLFEALPKDVIMEFDSGNCIEGGDDPMRVISKYRDRDMILHMKPFSVVRGFNIVLGDKDDLNDWEQLLIHCKKEYLWKLIESENDMLPEFENAELCMAAVNKIKNRFVSAQQPQTEIITKAAQK